MTEMTSISFEDFLVEDVILTLGNLRGALNWIASGDGDGRAGLARLDRQLSLLEERARQMHRRMQDRGRMDDTAPDNLFVADDPSMPIFHSQRAPRSKRGADRPPDS